jgi:hypothetical protein
MVVININDYWLTAQQSINRTCKHGETIKHENVVNIIIIIVINFLLF